MGSKRRVRRRWETWKTTDSSTSRCRGPRTEAINYNFGERGLCAEFVSKQFFLASTPSMGELMETLDIQGGGWRSFTSAYTGTLITTVRDETGVSDEMVEIYDGSLLPVSLGQSVLEAQLVEGESYVLHVVDTASSIQVSLQMQLDLSGVYTNPVDRLDVSGDGLISPVNALLVVNRLNQSGAKRVYGPQSEAPFHDTNADGLVSPLDALLVINRLNAPLSVEAEAAGPAESAPVIVAALVNDTASEEAFNSDRITSDPTIAIGVGGVFPIASVMAGFGQPDTDLSSALRPDGTYLLDPTVIDALFGPLADGDYVLQVQATDDQGNRSSIMDFALTLDTSAPEILGFDLAASSDSDPLGDQQTTFQRVTLEGQTDPGATIFLQELGLTTASNDQGQFSFVGCGAVAGPEHVHSAGHRHGGQPRGQLRGAVYADCRRR